LKSAFDYQDIGLKEGRSLEAKKLVAGLIVNAALS
jgi:hypothetical protein